MNNLRLLAIDTSTESIILALYNCGDKKYFVGKDNAKMHNQVLLTNINDFLYNQGLSINDIDVFGIVSGPGSFTGIRIGVATVNALALALNKKTVEITSLEQLDDGTQKIVLIDCKHDNYYAGIFGEKTQYLALSKDELNEYDLPKHYLTKSIPEKVLDKCLQKVQRNEFTTQSKPFYMKKSSAER